MQFTFINSMCGHTALLHESLYTETAFKLCMAFTRITHGAAWWEPVSYVIRHLAGHFGLNAV